MKIPWTEKYRPKIIDDLVVDSETYNKINKIIEIKEMPNIIITGVPGIGKTTTILCIARKLLGPYYKEGVLEINASDDRGIKGSDSITNFCKKKFNTDKKNKYTKHKIVLLDEADNMTKKLQQLVKNLMENYHHTTRFAFTCNNSSDIIEAIQSRCIIFRYRRLTIEQMLERLTYICRTENVNYTKKGLMAVIMTSQGDLRKAINNLQLTYNGYGKILQSNVYKLCDQPHPLILKKIFIACRDKDIKTALTNLNKLKNEGYSSLDIAMSMNDTLKYIDNKDLKESVKIKIMSEINQTCLIISKGINTPLQLSGCIAYLCLN